MNIYVCSIMEKSNDFKELFELFNRHNVEYVIVGDYALAVHGAPRFTGDIDVLINATGSNARQALAALDEFGFGSLGLTLDDFIQPNQILQLGCPPSRVDILTSISGVDWGEVADNALNDYFMGEPVRYIGLDQFIENKKATGRPKDLADIDAIENRN